MSSLVYTEQAARKAAQEEEQRRAEEARSTRIDKLAENSLDELIKKRQEKIAKAEKEQNEKLSELGGLGARRAAIADDFNEADVDTSEFDEAIKRRKELDKPVIAKVPVVEDNPKEVVGVKRPLVSVDSISTAIPSVPLSSPLTMAPPPPPPLTITPPPPPPLTMAPPPPPPLTITPPPPPPLTMAPPPPPVKQDIFAGINENINDKSLSFSERFSLLFAVPKAIPTESVPAKATATQVIDPTALITSLNSDESPQERLRKMREARAAKGAKAAVVTEKVADKPKSLKEELAEAVKKKSG